MRYRCSNVTVWEAWVEWAVAGAMDRGLATGTTAGAIIKVVAGKVGVCGWTGVRKGVWVL